LGAYFAYMGQKTLPFDYVIVPQNANTQHRAV